MTRWRGLAALITDGVTHGSTAIERIHLQTAAKPFRFLELIPGIAAPAAAIHTVHDLVVRGTYASVRGAAQVVGSVADAALQAAEDRKSDH